MIFKDKKAQGLMGIIVFIVSSFVILMFFAMYLYGHALITNTLTSIPSTEALNLSLYAQQTFGQVDSALQELKWIAFVLIIGQIIFMFLMNAFTRAHPILFIPYVFMNIVAVILAVIISNQYENLLTNTIIGATLGEFKAGTFVMLNLPVISVVVGFFATIFLLVGITRDREIENRGGVLQ